MADPQTCSDYNSIIDQLILQQNSGSETLLNIDELREKLKNIESCETQKDIIWNYLTNQYTSNEMILSTTNTAFEDSFKINVNKDKVKEKLKQDLKKIENTNSTSKAIIESNNYEYHKMMHELKVYRMMFIIALVCLIFPLLYIFPWGPLSRVGAFIIWVIIMFVLFLYAFSEIVYKARDRDEKIFSKRNFEKPSGSVIARSKEQAFKEEVEEKNKMGNIDFNPRNIDIGDIDRYKSDGTKKCDAPQDDQ